MENSQEKASIPNHSGNNLSHGGIRTRFGLPFTLPVVPVFLIYEQTDADTLTMHDTVSFDTCIFMNMELIHAFSSCAVRFFESVCHLQDCAHPTKNFAYRDV